MKVIESYGRAIENSDENLFKELFAPQVRIEIPVCSLTNHGDTKLKIIRRFK